ncbi:hypothetical protein BWQ96_00997 [Gracilariopsis chorda]|uniref:Uncharacterized protein n=1 Tax=Gracilariopsis chorda TaxID=448386 RepID=A0A2V3J465_9FLOR|nr:hypothetical protein BWQ96_00997 [Gracilariopsis chorda]|eukprot:PXF49208.1 hypothetical protein BWQ96_00997 [Gracilariopsis chorda]
MFVFRVNIHGQEYCVKEGPEWISCSAEKLQKALNVTPHLEEMVVNRDVKILSVETMWKNRSQMPCNLCTSAA